MIAGGLGRSSLALALVAVVALAALGGLAWFVSRGSSTSGIERAPLAGVEAPAGGAESDAGEAARASQTGAREAEAKPSLAPPPIATGTLRIRVLDEATRAPLARLSFLVVRERGGESVLARGTTGTDGRAEVRGLEEDTLLVRTERQPPHAPACAPVVVLADSPQEFEILVGGGGAITGRVVDDRKLPVAGAGLHLLAATSAFDLPEPLARSGPDGRFRIECVACEPQAESCKPVPVLAELGGLSAAVQAVPRPGDEVDVGDLELARAARFLGRVVDPDERPVAQALVSLRGARLYARTRRPQGALDEVLRRGPGEAGFQLLAGEMLTDSGGRFELAADGRGTSVVVWTRTGALQEFKLPATAPGEKRDEIVLRLDPRTSVVLELVDASGASAPVPAAEISSSGLWAPWGAAGVFGDGRVSALARAGGATLAWDSNGVRSEDGKWRLELRVPPEEIEELAIAASGYEPRLEHPPAGFRAPVELRLVLEPLPWLHLRLVPQDRGAKLLPAPGEALQLHVCMADPLRHGNAALGFCCGNGVFWKGRWRGEVLALVLPVRRPAAFFVHARGRSSDGEYHDVASFGPFDPGAEERELVLDPARLTGVQAGGTARGERFVPGPFDPCARVSARFEDARTGRPIPSAALLFDEVVAAPRQPRAQRLDADEGGRLRSAPVRVGRWTVRAIVRGYARLSVAERDFAAGQSVDLGLLALEPLPIHTGRLLDASGNPVGKAWFALLDGSSAELDASRMSESTEQGFFSFHGELPEKFVLNVELQAPGPGEPREAQRFALEAWPAGAAREVRLRPSRRVVLLLNGTTPAEVPLSLSVCPSYLEPSSVCDHRAPIQGAHLPLATSVALEPQHGIQRCALRLAPGRYQLYGQNLLHALPLTEIVVGEETGDLELTLGVQ